MNWTQIEQPEDPDWQEFHRQWMSAQWGRVMLKVWLDGAGRYRASATGAKHQERRVTILDAAGSMEAAKTAALFWAK